MTLVAVAILIKNGKILICQRKRNSRYGLKWEFPGGKVENGESVQQCLQRELKEELSIVIGPINKTEVESYNYEDGGRFEVHYCFVRNFDGDLKNNVFEEVRWVSPGELQSLDHLEGNWPIIRKLDERAFEAS